MRSTRSKGGGVAQSSDEEQVNDQNNETEIPEEFDGTGTKYKPSKKPRVSLSTLSVAEQRKRALEFAEKYLDPPKKSTKTSNPSSVHGNVESNATVVDKTVSIEPQEQSKDEAVVLTKPKTRRSSLGSRQPSSDSFDPNASQLSNDSSVMTDVSVSGRPRRSTRRSLEPKIDDTSDNSTTEPPKSARKSRRINKPETIPEENDEQLEQAVPVPVPVSPVKVNTAPVTTTTPVNKEDKPVVTPTTVPIKESIKDDDVTRDRRNSTFNENKEEASSTKKNNNTDHQTSLPEEETSSPEELDITELLISAAKLQSLLMFGLVGYYSEFRYLAFTGVTAVTISLFRRALFPSDEDEE